MRLALIVPVILTLLTAACQATPPRVSSADTRSTRNATPRPAASSQPRASATPVVSPTPAGLASAAAALAATLQRPTGDVTLLSGTVAIDATYLVAAGAGNIISHNGGQIVAAGGLNLLGADGASLVAAGAGNLVAAGAGNLVAAGGGNIVAAGGGNYALTQATPSGSATPLTSEYGTVLPAAGMQLTVRDLRTGAPVALGEDGRGEPVYAVYSSAEGGFELYVPRAIASNVRIDARVTGATDPRLAYEVLAQPGGAPAAIDEDSALVYHYLAESWRGRMSGLMIELAAEPPRSDDEVLKKLYGARGGATHTAMLQLLKPLLVDLRQAIRGAQLSDEQALRAASARAADAVLARADLSGLVATQAPEYAKYLNGEEKAFTVFIDAVREVRARAAAQMREARRAGGQATFLAGPLFAAAGERIVRPADVPAFLVTEAFTDEQDIQQGLAAKYMEALGTSKAEALRWQGRVWAANVAAGEHLGILLATDPGVRADFIAALNVR